MYDDGDSEDLRLNDLVKLASMESNINQDGGGGGSNYGILDKAVEVYRGSTLVARFRTQKECATYLQVSKTTVGNHCRNGGGIYNGLEIRPRHLPASLVASVGFGIFEDSTPRPRSTDPVELASTDPNNRDRAPVGYKPNDDADDAGKAPSRGPTNKRKYASDPTAAAARDVLSDTDDEYGALCDTDDELNSDAHVASRKKTPSMHKKYELGHLKPLFDGKIC